MTQVHLSMIETRRAHNRVNRETTFRRFQRWGLLSGGCLALAGCAPGYAESEQFAERAVDLTASVTPTGSDTAGVLGQGRDTITEEFRGDCVRSQTRVNIPLQEASLRFDSSLLKEEASEKLGFSIDSKARFKLVSGSARARFSRSLTNTSLSLGMHYVADYSMGIERLDQAGLEWLVPPDDPEWNSRCGDQFLQQKEIGGQLFLLYRIDFASTEAKQEFESSVGVTFPAAEVNVAVNRAASRFLNRASVHVEAFQVGGDVTRLSSILGNGGPDAGAGRVIIDCSMANIAPCGQFMQNAIQYASAQSDGSFSATLRQSPADRSYTFKDWGVLGLSLPQRRVPAAVKSTRVSLRRLFDGQVEFADRVALLRGGSMFVQPDLRAQLDGYAQKAQNNLAILSDAVELCYDYLTDPSNEDQVDDCTGMVQALDAHGYDRSLTMDKLTVPPPSLGTKVIERTDPSGKVTVAVFERQADTAAQHFTDFPVSVTPDFVVVGGGAEGANLPYGNLLTASYPSGDGWSWFASSKDHVIGNPIKLKVYAIGLKIAGMTRDELREAVLVQSASSAPALAPEATVRLSSDYALLGGGFLVHHGDGGNLAVGSFPVDAQTWRAKSKSHVYADSSTIDVFAIGLRRALPAVGNISTTIQSAVSGVQSHPSVFAKAPDRTLLVGCGAVATVTGPCMLGRLPLCTPLLHGQLLWKLKPDSTLAACDVSSKDHKNGSPGTVTGYALGISVD